MYNKDGMEHAMRKSMVFIVGVCVAVSHTQLCAEAADEILYFSYKVLDKSGQPVPASVSLVAVDDKGKPYGPSHTWSTGISANSEGMGQMGFGSSPKKMPGKLQIVAEHPAIAPVRMTIEWSMVLNAIRPTKNYSRPHFILKSTGGIGFEEWKKQATQQAQILMRKLANAKSEKQVNDITAQIIRNRVFSIGEFVKVLDDYDNPLRMAFVGSFLRCRHCSDFGMADLSKEAKAKADAIYAVHSHLWVIQRKPKESPAAILKLGNVCLREMRWLIAELKKPTEGKGEATDSPNRQHMVKVLEQVIAKIEKE